jgi:hypothetical protein
MGPRLVIESFRTSNKSKHHEETYTNGKSRSRFADDGAGWRFREPVPVEVRTEAAIANGLPMVQFWAAAMEVGICRK